MGYLQAQGATGDSFSFCLGFLHGRCCWCIFESIRKLAAGVTTRQEQLPAAAFRLIRKQEDEKEELNLAKSYAGQPAVPRQTWDEFVNKQCFRIQTICMITRPQHVKISLETQPSFFVSDCLTWNCHLSGDNLRCMRSVAQHDCPWQSGSGESIWVRKDNPLTPKEDWRISQALMSCELVFISHHKNRAVCVAARALQHDHHVTESIMGNCYCAGENGGKREQEVE